ncbi:maleylpyruvate isomerase family mycothiol-dependent enzyme [Nocardioides terrae]|uniref:maleylpyruvate isomerase family mycothiol-dependent enzyme n=1 Tax=Nocardioides terrae TaxID=574651 RepID=UPI001587D436|nr:maleylpyruvate isomerase family mycothiol-dependent enzyme [Nocardioides terrae]
MSHPTSTADLLHTASQRLVRTVDSLDGDAWARPSLLPRWTVAHVLAHVALNAEALAGVLTGVAHGRPVSMYASQDARDGDIAELGAAEPAEIRDRVFASVTRFSDALAALPEDRAGERVERTPGSGTFFPAGAAASMRLREVEIHHADLDAGYAPADWPDEFTIRLLDHVAGHFTDHPAGTSGGSGFRAEATDLGRTWEFGTGDATVTGTGHELAWWATGRPAYPGTTGPTSADGMLPRANAI